MEVLTFNADLTFKNDILEIKWNNLINVWLNLTLSLQSKCKSDPLANIIQESHHWPEAWLEFKDNLF